MWVRRLGVADRINIKENRVFNTWLGQEILLAIKLPSGQIPCRIHRSTLLTFLLAINSTRAFGEISLNNNIDNAAYLFVP